MALYHFLCGLTVMIILSSTGCLSEQPKCGRASRNATILGGQNAPPQGWPWQVYLNISFGNYRGICGGSLISDQWVLTAAQCAVNAIYIKAHLGRHNLSGPNPNEVSRRINQTICHPSFSSKTFNNDICLLKLSAPVNLTDYIYPVCLASANSTFYNGTSSWVSACGFNGTLPNVPREVKVPIVGNKECNCSYGTITENMICAGRKRMGECQGDTGSPLATRNDSYWVQSGIVSFSAGCLRPLRPDVYTRVSSYEEWISNVTGSSKPGFVTFTSPGPNPDLNFTCPTPPPPTPPRNTTTRSPPTTPAVTDKDDSVFGGGDNVVHFSHFSHFISLCTLLLSLFVLVGDA